MAQTLESIAKDLGKLRKDLIEEGFPEDQAYQVVIDLIRRGTDFPGILTLGTELGD